MKLKKEFIEKLKQENMIKVTTKDHYRNNDILNYLLMEQLDENYKLLSIITSGNFNNKFYEQYKNGIAIINNDFEVNFLVNNWRTRQINECILDALPVEISQLINNSNEIQVNVKNKVEKKLLEELKLLDKQILKTVDLKKYEEETIKLYLDNQKPEINLKNLIDVNQDILIDYFNNNGELKKSVVSSLSDQHLAQYEKYVVQKEIIKQYEEKLNTEPGLKNINAIINIINDDKKSFNIKYHDLNGNVKKEQFKKNATNLKIITNTILKHNVLSSIPIELIDEINWRSTTLYKKDETCKFKYNDKETSLRLALLNHIQDINISTFYDENFIIEAICNNARLIKSIPEEVIANKDIALKIIKNIKENCPNITKECLPNYDSWEHKRYQNMYYIFQNLPETIKKDKEFLKEYLKLHKNKLPQYAGYSTSLPYIEDLVLCIKPYLSNIDFAKIALEYSKFDHSVILATPDYIINDKRILDIAEKYKDNLSAKLTLFNKIEKIEDLEKIFDKEYICDNICSLNSNILCNKSYIYENITNEALRQDNILSIYNEESDIINKIFENATSKFSCKMFLDTIYPEANNIKIFELCSKNIYFYQLLDKDDTQIFIDGEMSDIENIIVNNKNIELTTPNCIITIEQGGYISLANREKRDEKCLIKSKYSSEEYFENKIIEALKDKYKLRSKLFNSIIDEVITHYKINEIER